MKSLIVCLFLIVLGAGIYLTTLKGVWGNPTVSEIKNNINDETRPNGIAPDRGRFILAQNLVENHTFALNREQAEAASPDVGYYKGNYFIFFAPGISILAIPFYIIGTQYNLSQVATFAMGGIFAILDLILIFLICKKILNLPFWASIFASLTFGFASTSLSYAATLYQHLPTVFLILSSFYATWLYRRFKNWGFLYGFYIWFAYGLAILLDYPNAILMAPIMVYFLMSSFKVQAVAESFKLSIRPSILLTSIFFIAITAGHLYYNHVNFGSWKSLSGNIIGLKVIQEKHLDQGDLEQNIHNLNQNKNTAGALKENNIVNSSYELFIAPDKGILIFSPIFILGILGIFLAVIQKKVSIEVGILIALATTNFMFYAGWGDPWGGWAFGPRYLIPSMSVLAIFVAFWLANFPRLKILNKFLALILFIYSAGVSLVGALTTNAVPPKIEAVFLHSKYGYFFNFDFLFQNKSSGFVYNYFFRNNYTLVDYYLVILSFVIFLAFITLVIMPLFERRKSAHDNIHD